MNQVKHKVQVCVISMSGQSLLLLQTKKERGSFWQNITGHVEDGESLLFAAQREALEETGLNAKQFAWAELNTSFQYTKTWPDGNTFDYTETCYLALLKELNNPSITLDKREHQAFKWKDLSSISMADFKYESNFEVFLAAKRKMQSL